MFVGVVYPGFSFWKVEYYVIGKISSIHIATNMLVCKYNEDSVCIHQ